jgi:catechol 2,3-dioxygenase-like lactoylglutathione lyase family enzyme
MNAANTFPAEPGLAPGPHLKFHHLGLAARRPDEARAFLAALGCRMGEEVFDPSQNVHLQLCTHPTHPAVEIIWPGETKGPIEKLTERHASGIIYHVCYETDNLPAALARFAEARLRVVCISSPTPAPLFGGRKVSFYNVMGMGLIEILE